MAITSDKRGYIAGKYAVELDNINAGWVSSAEGGHASADVVMEKVGGDHIIKKHVGSPKYEDITVSCGTGMSKGFYDWIKASFDHNYARKNGAIITADYNYKEHTRLNFFNALITEIGFPALDAASKDPAKMTIKITPENTTYQLGQGASIANSQKNDQATQKKWLPANFRLSIDGMDCTRVNKIEAITIKQKCVDNPTGELRGCEKEPAHVEIPNLVITLAESHSKEFYDWHKSFVIDGKNGDGDEKSGQLTYLTPDLKTELCTITFSHLGIFKLTPEKVEAGSENIRRIKCEMYCEDMKFEFKSSTWA